eukprot:4421661-Pyramimonas_sp.AAC.1
MLGQVGPASVLDALHQRMMASTSGAAPMAPAGMPPRRAAQIGPGLEEFLVCLSPLLFLSFV